MNTVRATIRLDKWLWFARFFKTRALAASVVAGGHVRVNSRKVEKPATAIGEGDTLTFPQGGRIRVVRVTAAGLRRGPASEAVGLYEDLDGEPVPQAEVPPSRPSGEQDR